MFEYGFPKHWTTLKKLIFLSLFLDGSGEQIVWTTVTGTSPLLLENALAHSIKSLTQFGKCVQNGTPTPDAPVDIVTNNGALRMVDDELPSGYKRLQGITFDGEVYYVTNYHMRGADTLRFSFKATRDARNIIGCYNSTSATDNLSFYFLGGSSGTYLRYNGGLYRPVAWTNTVYNCIISPTGVTGLGTNASWTEADFTSAAAMFIGWLDNATSPKFIGDMYGSIVVDGRANFIPVERQSDGAIGYWDGQAFLENQGTGTPVSLGYDGSHYQLSVSGTPEVLTVGGQNLVDLSAVTDGYYYDASGVYSVADNARLTDYIPVRAGQKYTVYAQAVQSGSSVNVRCNLFDTGKVWKSQSVFVVAAGNSDVSTITPTENGFLRVSANYAGTGAKADWSTLQIVRGEYTLATMPPYEPYHVPQTITDIPMLLGVGDYKDAAELIQGIKTGKVGIKVFDGTETFTVSSSGAMITAISDVAVGAQNTPINTHFALEISATSIAAGKQRFGSNGALIYSTNYYMKHPTIKTVADFKAWLAAQYAAGTPVIVLYPLAESTTEQTTPHALNSYNGTTIVTADTNVDPVTLEVEYAASA